MHFKALFSPVRTGNLEISNRFVVPPMGTNHANGDGTVSERNIEYWKARAKGGWGLIIVEVTAIDPLGKAIPYQLGLWDDKFIEGFRRATEAVHKYGSKIAVQLHHAGRQTFSSVIGDQPVAPSPVSCPVCREVPRELTGEEIYGLIDKFGDAAVRAREAGFDMVEIHGAHGYLIAQFMSPNANKRVDEFGGSFYNRMRFPLEIIRNVRGKVGGGFPLSFRFSAEERVIGGRDLEESLAVSRLVEEAGVDVLNVSVGAYGSMEYIFATPELPPGHSLSLAAEVKTAVKIPVIAVGRFNEAVLAESAVQMGKADLIAWGRQSLADPELPNKVAAGNLEDITPCIACNQGCVGYMFDPDKLLVSCLVNPFCGREVEMKIEPAHRKKKVVVVGAGPGGLEVSWVAAARGHQVVLYEKEPAAGGQWRIGAIPPAKQTIATAINYYLRMCQKHGVKLNLGTEASVEKILAEKPDTVILATGGEADIPLLKGIDDHPRVVVAAEVLEGKAPVGHRVLIIGGGLVGCETADFLGEQGHEITIIEMLPEIARDVQDVVRFFLLNRLKKYGVQVETETRARECTENGIIAEKRGQELRLEGYDHIILATGIKPVRRLEDKLQGKVAELYIIGDASLPRKAIDAIEEGAFLAVKL
ncbi:MAG TPA: FAD-dependent oxidoreductase [Firmicutes bacterium]|nr:FAD-dependent oxidoreductase [Bacillota bacterium]